MLTTLQTRTAKAIVNVFETSRASGSYGKIGLIPGDTGGLSYGLFQAALGAGTLHDLMKEYCEEPGAKLAQDFTPFLDGLHARASALNSNATLRGLLEDAAADEAMRRVQDRFFDVRYWVPSLKAAVKIGAETPLGVAVIYDSHIQGSWAPLRDRTAKAMGPTAPQGGGPGEKAWIERYVQERRAWLANHANKALRDTVYRMDSFASLILADKWLLPLPLFVRGVLIDEAALDGTTTAPRTLKLRTPAMQGEDVRATQRALATAGFPCAPDDGAFGSATDTAARAFQNARGLVVDGLVGPGTRKALGL